MNKVAGLIAGVVALAAALALGSAHQKPSARTSLTPEQIEWFTTTLESLEAKGAALQVYQGRIDSLEEAYDFTPISEWAPVDQSAFQLATHEIEKLKKEFDALTIEYNSRESQYDWGDNYPSLPLLKQPNPEP